MSDERKTDIEESSSPGAPAWMLTYADTVTLLMTFFVMLMSFSTFDTGKFSKAMGALSGQLGIGRKDRLKCDSLLTRRNMNASRIHANGYENPPEYDPLNYVAEQFDYLVRTNSLVNMLRYKLTEHGFEVHLLPGAIFEEGTAELRRDAQRLLRVIGKAVAHIPHELRVLATADLFYASAYAAPEDLAVDRAAVVCDYLHREFDIAPGRLSLAVPIQGGWPRAADDHAAGVRIVVLRPPRRAMP